MNQADSIVAHVRGRIAQKMDEIGHIRELEISEDDLNAYIDEQIRIHDDEITRAHQQGRILDNLYGVELWVKRMGG